LQTQGDRRTFQGERVSALQNATYEEHVSRRGGGPTGVVGRLGTAAVRCIVCMTPPQCIRLQIRRRTMAGWPLREATPSRHRRRNQKPQGSTTTSLLLPSTRTRTQVCPCAAIRAPLRLHSNGRSMPGHYVRVWARVGGLLNTSSSQAAKQQRRRSRGGWPGARPELGRRRGGMWNCGGGFLQKTGTPDRSARCDRSSFRELAGREPPWTGTAATFQVLSPVPQFIRSAPRKHARLQCSTAQRQVFHVLHLAGAWHGHGGWDADRPGKYLGE